MRRLHLCWIGSCALLLGCITPPLETPTVGGSHIEETPLPLNVRDKADILFLIDNSGSMGDMQDELKRRFEQFFAPFAERAAHGQYADLHIGVVTSDYGAGATSNGSCSPSPGGGRGRLVARGAKADTSCKAPLGANFIQYSFAADGVNNLPMGQDLPRTFTCMA